MTKPEILLAFYLVSLLPAATGCGQKGPLYLDNTADETVERVTPEEEARQNELKDLERRNDSQPDITY